MKRYLSICLATLAIVISGCTCLDTPRGFTVHEEVIPTQNSSDYYRKYKFTLPNEYRYNSSPSVPSTSGSSTSDAPCVTGYCGPVHVRGYYRKDGTYVRPHTRRR